MTQFKVDECFKLCTNLNNFVNSGCPDCAWIIIREIINTHINGDTER